MINGQEKQQSKKVYRTRIDPFQISDVEFVGRYRFSKQTVNKIIDLVKNDIYLDGRGCGSSPSLQVLVALRCWGRREVSN